MLCDYIAIMQENRPEPFCVTVNVEFTVKVLLFSAQRNSNEQSYTSAVKAASRTSI